MARVYTLIFYSNNSDITIIETITCNDLASAITDAKTILAGLNAAAGLPHDFRIKNLCYQRESA